MKCREYRDSKRLPIGSQHFHVSSCLQGNNVSDIPFKMTNSFTLPMSTLQMTGSKASTATIALSQHKWVLTLTKDQMSLGTKGRAPFFLNG